MSEKEYINLCKTLITKRYPLGIQSGQWRQRDIEALSQIIEEKSGIRLSLSTLKRFWKTDFNQTPHPSTLDAIVALLDHKDWLDFKNNHQIGATSGGVRTGSWLIWALLAVAFIFVGFLVIGPGFQEPPSNFGTPTANGAVNFSASKTMDTGVPNTVIFKYDVQNIQADSFYLQQSWNELHRVPINPDAGNYSSTYYTPGFHRAKLVANDSIFKVVKVHIQTNGWLPLARYHRNDLVPIYLRDPTIVNEGQLSVTPKQLRSAGVDLTRDFTLNYHNVREFDGLHSDNFQLRTRIRNDSIGNFACPFFSVTILCEEHIFYVPLTSKGCVGNLEVKFGEVVSSGHNSDLRTFGRDMYEWQDLLITVKNKNAQVFVADQLIYESNYYQEFGNIKGLVLKFSGSGSVDFIELMDPDNKLIFQDSFI